MILFPLLLSAQIPDEKIEHCIEQYFKLNRLGPELARIDLFDHPELGRIIKITIIARRTQPRKDLIFAFTAIAAVASLAKADYDLLWVEMGVNFRDLETTNAIAPVDCSIDTIILQNNDIKNWWEGCLQLLSTSDKYPDWSLIYEN